MGPCAQSDVLAVQANQLGDSQTGLNRDQQEGSIATPHPRGRTWHGKQGIDLFPVEKVDRALFMAFIGHR